MLLGDRVGLRVDLELFNWLLFVDENITRLDVSMFLNHLFRILDEVFYFGLGQISKHFTSFRVQIRSVLLRRVSFRSILLRIFLGRDNFGNSRNGYL